MNTADIAGILFQYGSLESYFSKYFYSYIADIQCEYDIKSDDEDDKDTILEDIACDLTKKHFKNNQDILPNLVRYLDKIVV